MDTVNPVLRMFSDIPVIGGLFGGFADERNYDREKADRDRLLYEEREYNSPKKQAERMLAAGLNPYYSGVDSGNVSAPAIIEAPKGDGKGLNMAGAVDLMIGLQSLNTAYIQQKLLDTQKAKLEQEILFNKDMNPERVTSQRLENLVTSARERFLEKTNRNLEWDYRGRAALDRITGHRGAEFEYFTKNKKPYNEQTGVIQLIKAIASGFGF